MLRWNSGPLLAVVIILISALDQRIGPTCSAQSPNAQNQNGSYYSRSNWNANAATQTEPNPNSTRQLTRERYEELLLQNSLLPQSQTQSGNGLPDANSQNRFVRREIPERLIPPGRTVSQLSAGPVGNTHPLANPSSNEPVTRNGFPSAAGPTSLSISQAYLPPIVQSADLQNVRIPTVYSNSDGRVTYATILNVQPASEPAGQTGQQQGNSDDLAPQQDNPFADPPGNDWSIQDQQNPFADPPQNAVLPDQQNPFADPPEDMDPSRFQDPFSPTQRQPDVDPFANSPKNIVPPTEFLIPSESAADNGMDSEANSVTSEAAKLNPKGTGIAGPFKSRGFAPTPIQPAPPRQNLEFLNSQFAPGAAEAFYPNSHAAQGWDSQLDQPTLVDVANQGFQKSDLYDGMTQSCEDNDFATYECASCNQNSHLPGKHFFSRKRCYMAGQCSSANSCYESNCQSNCDPGTDCSVADCSDTYYPDECNSCFELQAGNCSEPMFYFAVFGGYVQLEDTRPFEAVNTIGIASSDAALSFNDGFGIGVAIGQIQGENLRTEIEFAFRDNNVSELILDQPNLSSSVPDLDGSIESFSGMMNFIWDFGDRPCFCGVRPYAGGGVGFAILESTLTDGANSIVVDSFGSDSSFAYQLLAGLSRPVSARLDGFIEYRYFKAESFRLNINVPSTLTGDVEYETDNVFFGLRMYF